MTLFKELIFILLILYICFLGSRFVSAVETAGTTGFDLLLWPERGGLIDSVTGSTDIRESLKNAWFDAHIPIYTNMNAVRIIQLENDSLETYLEQIRNLHPSGIEGDASYIEQEINRKERLYLPLLQIQFPPKSASKVTGEILFRSSAAQWEGTLGLVHPAFGVGGKAQIEYWREKTGKEPNWVAFYSTRELLRHLFAGSVQAAAVPQGAVEVFLEELKRMDILSQLARIAVPQTTPACAIYLRADLYHKPLYRTLISETWLRDRFPNFFQILPAAKPNY